MNSNDSIFHLIECLRSLILIQIPTNRILIDPFGCYQFGFVSFFPNLFFFISIFSCFLNKSHLNINISTKTTSEMPFITLSSIIATYSPKVYSNCALRTCIHIWYAYFFRIFIILLILFIVYFCI